MRKIFFIVSLLNCFIVLLLLHPKPAISQGTFSCQFQGDPVNLIPNSCTLASSNCQAGYQPDDCNLWITSQEQCQGIHQCVTETPADFGCSQTDALGQCIFPSPTLFPCVGTVYCCQVISDCGRIKAKQTNVLPTPTPTSISNPSVSCATINPTTPIEGGEVTITISETIKDHVYWIGLEQPKGVWVYTSRYQRANFNGESLDFIFIAPKAGIYWLTARSTDIGEIPCINKQEFNIVSGGIPTPPGGQYYKCEFTKKECVACDPGELGCIYPDSSCYGECEKRIVLDINCETNFAGRMVTGVKTALGCIPTEDAATFIKWFLGRAILLAGGIAFLLMLSGGLMIIVSSGDPNRVKAGSQLITSALAGLIFIIFSLFLLRLIGIELLALPGL